MSDPNHILLYVTEARRSAAFYADLLGKPPIESHPNFALFALESGVMLGLWARAEAQPAPTAAPGGVELGFVVESQAEVNARFAAWQERGLTILQPPTALDFGFTFTAADPDGHRLRVMALGPA